MSRQEIDAYLALLEEPKRGTLERLRQTIRGILPDSEEGIAYGSPAFRLHGSVIAGFAAFKNHLSYLPHSDSVLGRLPDEVASYVTSRVPCSFQSTSRSPSSW